LSKIPHSLLNSSHYLHHSVAHMPSDIFRG
jgi:hypothetical protein